MKKIFLIISFIFPLISFSQETNLNIIQLKDSLTKYQYIIPDRYIKYASILEKKLTSKQQIKELVLLRVH
jgi:hypothetical protein